MTLLTTARLDFVKADHEVDTFKLWLDAHPVFSESEVVSELRARPNLCMLVGMAAGQGLPDRYRHEFCIQGVFRADYVVGCTSTGHFVLVEFEGGTAASVFKTNRGTARMRDWGNELQHAFSQVSDWTWAKNDAQHGDLYRAAFGLDRTSETYLVVCGRDTHLGAIERSRLFWRSSRTMIASASIRFWTYDDLLTQVTAQLDIYRALRDAAAVPPPS